MIETYLARREQLKLLMLLVDIDATPAPSKLISLAGPQRMGWRSYRLQLNLISYLHRSESLL